LTAELGRRAAGPRLELDGEYWVWSRDMQGRVEGTIQFDHDDDEASLEEFYLCPGDEDCAFSRERVWYRADCVGRGCPTHEVRFYDQPMLGVEIVETTAELSRHLGGERGGVLIGKVMRGSPAELAGVEVGDLIVAVDGASTEHADDLRRAIRDGAGREVEIELIRDGRERRLSASIDDPGRSGPQR
jgi:hypothetical protein